MKSILYLKYYSQLKLNFVQHPKTNKKYYCAKRYVVRIITPNPGSVSAYNNTLVSLSKVQMRNNQFVQFGYGHNSGILNVSTCCVPCIPLHNLK